MSYIYIKTFLIRATAMLVGLCLTIYIAREYTPNEVGEYFYFLQLLTSISILSRYGSDGALLKYAHSFNSEDKKRAFYYSSKIAVSFLFLLSAFSYLLSQYIEIDNVELINFGVEVLALVILPFSILQYISEFLRGDNKQNIANTIQLFVIPFCMLVLIYNGYFPLNASFIISVYVGAALAVFCFIKHKQMITTESSTFFKYKADLSGFFVISLMNLIMGSLDVIMIGGILGMSDVSAYVLPYKLVTISSVLLVVVNGIVGPIYSKLWLGNDIVKIRKLYQQLSKYLVLVSIFLLAFFIIFGEFLLEYLFTNTYTNSYQLLVVMAISQTVVLATGPVAYLLMMTNNLKLHKQSMYISVITNIVLNIILIPIYGAIGAAVATGISLIFKNLYSFYKANEALSLIKFGEMKWLS